MNREHHVTRNKIGYLFNFNLFCILVFRYKGFIVEKKLCFNFIVFSFSSLFEECTVRHLFILCRLFKLFCIQCLGRGSTVGINSSRGLKIWRKKWKISLLNKSTIECKKLNENIKTFNLKGTNLSDSDTILEFYMLGLDQISELRRKLFEK